MQAEQARPHVVPPQRLDLRQVLWSTLQTTRCQDTTCKKTEDIQPSTKEQGMQLYMCESMPKLTLYALRTSYDQQGNHSHGRRSCRRRHSLCAVPTMQHLEGQGAMPRTNKECMSLERAKGSHNCNAPSQSESDAMSLSLCLALPPNNLQTSNKSGLQTFGRERACVGNNGRLERGCLPRM